MPIVVGGTTIWGTAPYAGERNQQAIEQAIKDYKPPTQSGSSGTRDSEPKRDTGTGTKQDPLKPQVTLTPKVDTPTPSTRVSAETFRNIFTQPLTIRAAAADDSDKGIYSITGTDGSVTVVEAKDVYAAADLYGTYIGDPDTSIRRVDIGCYPPTYAEAKAKYERDPVPLGTYTPKTPQAAPALIDPALPTTAGTGAIDLGTVDIEPEPYLPVITTTYRYTTPSGTVHNFEAMTHDEAAAIVEKMGADLSTLSVTGQRSLSQSEIADILRTAAGRSEMDYARALVKYGQVEGVVPVRDGGTRDVMLISEADWLDMPKEYKDIVLSNGIEALEKHITADLPPEYRALVESTDFATAIAKYNADVERANEVLETLKWYKSKDGYDIVTPMELGKVTADDLKVAGFDTKAVDGVERYVNKLSALVETWNSEAADGTFLTSAAMKQGQLNDFNNAAIEAGIFTRYNIRANQIFNVAPAVLAQRWNEAITLEDKYRVAEIYAAYPAPERILSSTYRGMVAEAPDMDSVQRFVKQFTFGGAAATITPFVKEQYKDSLETMLKPYQTSDGRYDITKYLSRNPEDASLLARGGVDIKELAKAMDGQPVRTIIKGATAKDWAVAGLIVTAVGTGGASYLVAQPAKSALIAASGLSTLGLGTYATVDTVKYWRQMDNTQRAIAITFDVLLLTTGALATKSGLTGFKRHGGFAQIRNTIQRSYNSARAVIRRILPDTRATAAILDDLATAIRTGDRKLLTAAAKRLELAAAKLPKQLREAVQTKAKLLKEPEGMLQLKADVTGAPEPLADAIKTNDNWIWSLQEALNRIKRGTRRYNEVRRALDNALRRQEAIQAAIKKSRVATKEATVSPFEKVIWSKEAGKYVPATKTTALTTTKPAPAKPPITAKSSRFKLLQFGRKVRDLLKRNKKLTPAEVAKRYAIAAALLSRSLRKLPEKDRQEIARTSPAWQRVVQTKPDTLTHAVVAATTKDAPAVAPAPEPLTETETQPVLQPVAVQKTATATKTKTKTKLTEREALGIYPFFNIPQDVKTRYRRKPRIPSDEYEDISSRLPRDKSGIISRKQGIVWVTIFPPYRPKDRIYTRKRPYYAESGRGKGSPQRTLKTHGGKVPRLVTMPMGVVTTTIKGGAVITFTPRSTRRRRKGRRRGRLVYG